MSRSCLDLITIAWEVLPVSPVAFVAVEIVAVALAAIVFVEQLKPVFV